MMKIVLVDDDSLITESLEILLSADSAIRIVGKAANGSEALRLAASLKPDIMLMDIRMPEIDGIEATKRIVQAFPEIKIIMLTTFHDYKNIYSSLQSGASGYLLKSDDTARQIQTIRAVYEGLPVISQTALQELAKPAAINELTRRENEVLVHLANGMSNREIAQRLFISEGTVRNNISFILDKLGLRDRTQLAIFYWQNMAGR